jgi:hypothetical protein
MEQEQSKEFFWKTYEKLPEDLKEAIFSETNNQAVNTICSRLNLTEDQASLVAKYTGRTLMGLLPLKELPITLELELNVEESVASQIIKELNYAVFKHLRVSLNKIYSDNYFDNIPLEETKEDAKIEKDGIIKNKPVEQKKPIKYDGTDPYKETL